MSKQSDLKSTMGFRKKPAWPTCGNCKKFKSDMVKIKPLDCSSYTYTVEKNLRCSVGNFKVGKTDTCNEHDPKEVEK